MAELKFIITADNKGMMEALQETQQAMRTTARNVEQIGQLLDLQEFRDASASVTDFARKVYETTQESVSSLSSMRGEFESQAEAIKDSVDKILSGDRSAGWENTVKEYTQSLIGSSAAADAALAQQEQAVNALSEALDDLQQSQQAAFTAGDSGTAQALQGDIDALSSTLGQAKEQLAELGTQAEESGKQLANLYSALQQNTGDVQSLGQLWGEVGKQIGEAAKAAGNWATGNGKFQQSLSSMKDALGEMGSAFTPAIAGAKKMLVALRAMIATPIGAVLTAVVLALQAMHKWFTKSAEGQRAFAKVSGYITSVLGTLTDIAVAVGKYLFRAFTDPNKPLGAFARNLVGTFSNALKSVYHLVKGLGNSLASLGTIIKGIGTMSLDTISAGWERLKNAGTLMGQAFKEAGSAAANAFGTIINLGKSAAEVVSDVWNAASFSGFEKYVNDEIKKAQAAGQLKQDEVDATIKLQEAQAKQAEYDKKIGEQYEKLYKLKGKERQDAINELKKWQQAKFDDAIKAQTQLYEITKKNNSLHSSTLEDLQKERDLRTQVLQLEAQRANSTRMLARMEASNERQMAATAAKAAKSGGRTTSIDLKAVREAEAALAELERKQDNERISQQVAMEERLTAARIAVMKDGAEKVAAQREQENKAELLQLAEQMKAAKEAERERQLIRFKAEQNALPANERKPLESFKLDQSAIDKIVAQYEELGDLIKQRQQQIIEGESQSSMREYLKQYGTYQERRLAITEEYAEKIKQARTEGDKLMLAKQQESALSALDKDFGLQTQQMADLFADASNKSVKSIDKIIKKYEALVNFMQGVNGKSKIISRNDLLRLGFTDDDIKKVETGEIKLKDITEAIRNLRKEVEGKSPLKAFTADIDKAVAKIKDGDLVEGLNDITLAVQNFVPAIKTLTTSLSTAFGGDSRTTEGILGIIEAIPQLVTGVIQTLNGETEEGLANTANSILALSESIEKTKDEDSEFADWERLKEITENLVDVWDELIDKKKEYLSLSVGGDTLRTEKEIKELIENETEAWRELGEERLRAGASATHHSIGYRIMRDMTDEAMDAASKALGGNARDILGKTASGLFDLTSEQLQRLKEQAPQFWARLDKDVQNYLNNIIEGAERLEDVQQSVREQLTRTTFDDVKSNFLSQLSDMESAASDFSDDFSQMLFQAMLKTKFDELFNDRLDDWYEHFANSMKDSEISDSERNALLAEWDGIVADSMKLRDNLADVTGYAKSQSEGSGAYKAASSFSQEQGDELNGRLTAIQLGQVQANEQLTMAVMTLQSMSVVGQEQGNTLAEMRNLMLIGNGHLEDIARYTRIASQFGAQLDVIAEKIKTL